MKYQKGDKVIVLDLSYFKNHFHFEKCIEEYTVLDADEKYFSPYYEDYDKSFSGMNMFSIIHQDTGVAMYGGKRFFHKEKDRDIILKMIKDSVQEYDDFCKENDIKRKQDLQSIIIDSQREIDQIESGNGNWKCGFSVFNNKKYKEKVLSSINKIFNI